MILWHLFAEDSSLKAGLFNFKEGNVMDFGDQLSIFGDLFADPVVPSAKTKAQKKPDKKEQNKKAGKKVQLPVTINLLGFKPFTLTEEMAGDKEIEEGKIVKIVREKETWLPDALTYEDKSLRFSGVITVKGAASVSEMYFGPERIDLVDIPEEERGAAQLVAYFKTHYPEAAAAVSGIYVSDGKAYVIPQAEGALEVKSVQIPETEMYLRTLAGEIILLKREDLLPLTGVEEEDVTEDTEIKAEDLYQFLPEWLRGAAAFVKTKDETLLAVCRGKTKVGPQKTKYHIKGGAVISLYFIKYNLEPEELGKTELEEEDIRAFLVQKGHIEYGFPDTSIVISPYTDKAENKKYLLVSTRGSKKGAVSHPFFELGPDGFKWTGPKVPLFMLRRFVWAAREARRQWDGEVLLELFFFRDRYFWYIPHQRVSGASVVSEQEPWLENQVSSGAIKVGEWHSHGRIPAFFSSIDDADETFPGLYGVVGSLLEVPSFAWRAISPNGVEKLGNHQIFDVFDDDKEYDGRLGWFQNYVRSAFREIKKSVYSYPAYSSSGGNALLMDQEQARFWKEISDTKMIQNGDGSALLAAPGFVEDDAFKTGFDDTISNLLFNL